MATIRTADTADIADIRQLAQLTWAEAYKTILSPEQMAYMLELFYSPASLQRQMEEAGHQFILAIDGGATVAFASFGPKAADTPHIFRLHKIYIHPNQQGKGTGKLLLQYIYQAMAQCQATILELNVNRHNPARFFYEKMGFVIIKEEDIDIGNNYFMNDYVMEKRI
jgi:diamine N-acetyltransferase